MRHNVYLYILGMWGISYLIRVLPLTLIRREITNKTIRSFLFYVPYVTLAVMTIPSILSATQSPISAALRHEPLPGQRALLCGGVRGGAGDLTDAL